MTNHSEMQVDCCWAACPHFVHFLLSSWTNDDVVVQRFPSWSLAAGSLTLVRTQFLTAKHHETSPGPRLPNFVLLPPAGTQ